MNKEGKISRLGTLGNEYVHVVLRGGNGLPNYHPESVEKATKLMLEAGLRPNIIVDCSHANSSKQYEKQEEVAYEVLKQIKNGARNIVGIMLESNLFEGQQPFPENEEQRKNLKYGISITDSCIPPETTERIIREYAKVLRQMGRGGA
jgi:3-deoxy-7-phosphoheptulonate synthase